MNIVGKIATIWFFAMLVLTGCAHNTTSEVEVRSTETQLEPYRFGAVLPLTGSNAVHGTAAKAGIDIAIEDINAAGGINGRSVRVMYEDMQSDKKLAASAAQKLVDIDEVDALFTDTTPVAGVAAPIAESSHTPMLYFSGTTTFALNTTYVFKEYTDARVLCRALARQAMTDGHEHIALFGMQAEFTQMCEQGIRETADTALITVETYTAEEKTYRSQLTKIKGTDATAIIISSFANECPTVYKELRELEMKQQLYLAYSKTTCGNGDNTKLGAALLENARGADVNFDELSTDAVLASFRARIAGKTTQLEASAIFYDMVRQMAQAYDGCADTSCVAQHMRALRYSGISGSVSYDGGQIAQRETGLFVYNEGGWKALNNQTKMKP